MTVDEAYLKIADEAYSKIVEDWRRQRRTTMRSFSAGGSEMTVDEAYLQIVEGWLRQWRGIVWPPGCIDDLCKRIAAGHKE